MATVGNVLTFHRLDRSIYEKLIAFGSNTGVARSIIALWMWLELIGIDVIPYIMDCKNSSVVQRFMAEAEAILGCLRQGSPPLDDNNNLNPIPLTASLTTKSVMLRFFYCQWDVAVRGITLMIDGVGKLIFDDYLYALLHTYERAVSEAEEGRQVPLPAMPPELARSYSSEPEPVLSPQDFRSMIITFLKGRPIGLEDIIEYFTNKWRHCIEKVMIESPQLGEMPMYGCIIFTSDSFVDLAFKDEKLINFVINGKQMWVRKYTSKK